MKRFLLLFLFWLSGHAWADIAFFQLDQKPDQERFSLQELSEPIVKNLNAVPTGWASYFFGLGFMIDNVKYYVKPSHFMAKSRHDEVCTPTRETLAYQCVEGQRFAAGCHLLFFNAKKEWVGMYTININPKTPPFYCNDVAGMGVADKARNEMLVTSQYFLLNGSGARKVTELGSNFIRMTSLLRIKAINGKIEVEQDDTCLGNPNLIDNIPDARTALNICQKQTKLSQSQLMMEIENRNQSKLDAAEQATRQKAPIQYKPWIASGFMLYKKEEYDLDNDGIRDAILVLQSMDRSIRRVVILKGINNNTFFKTGESDKVAFCEACGTSIRTNEDPFKEIVLEKNKFTVINSVLGGDHWESRYSFAWSRIDKQWQLVEEVQYSGNFTERGFEDKSCTLRPPKDFGKIALENFAPDGSYLTSSAKKRCGISN